MICAFSSAEVKDIIVTHTSAAEAAEDILCALSSADDRDIRAFTSADVSDIICATDSHEDVDISYICASSPMYEDTKPTECTPATAVVGNANSTSTDCDDDVDYVMSVLSECSIEKFDSGASRCMSGDPSRLVAINPNIKNRVKIVGFNNTSSTPTTCGYNADNLEEYYVSDMPPNLTLLCANAYCQEGCAILFANDGLVLRMTPNELSSSKGIFTELSYS